MANPESKAPADRMQVRRLSPTDTGRLLAFYQALSDTVTFFYEPFGELNEDVIGRHLAGAEASKHISLGLWRQDGTVLGHAFVFDVEGNKPVFGIGLNESVQGRGWGRRMTAAALAEGDARGVPLVTLTVLKANHRAIKLYEKSGFVIKGEDSFRAAHDSHYMERRVTKECGSRKSP